MTFYDFYSSDYADIIRFIVFFLVFLFVKWQVLRHLNKLKSKTETKLDDFLYQVISEFSWIAILSLTILLTSKVEIFGFIMPKAITFISLVIFTFYVARSIFHLLKYVAESFIPLAKINKSIVKFIVGLSKYVVYFIAILFLLDNLGVNISSMVAGLGIGGIALALAVQNILGDLLSSFSIHLDKICEVGDSVEVNGVMGIVEKIGVKTIRLKTLQGEELIMSNSNFIDASIKNYKKMEKRRIVFNVGVVYEINLEKLKKIPTLLKDIIKSKENVEFGRVHFVKMNDFSLDFEVMYHVTTGNYDVYMDIQNDINYAIIEVFQKESIEIAYPTQVVYKKT